MLLELKHIYKTYQGKIDVPVLKNISFSIEEGEYVAIMGPSGSGKTTLMNLIGCLDYPSRGSYFLGDEDVSDYSESKLADVRLNSIGFVFQSFYLLSRQTALDNVALPLLYAGVKKKERNDIAREALERVGLADRIDFLPNQLSGGQSQRVAIARAMVNNPKILLADEPTGALDTASGKQIMELFKSLNDEGVTIIMITHEKEIAEHAERIIQIRDGRLIGPDGKFLAPEFEPDDPLAEESTAPESDELNIPMLSAPIKVKKSDVKRSDMTEKEISLQDTSTIDSSMAEKEAENEILPPDVAAIKQLMEEKLSVSDDNDVVEDTANETNNKAKATEALNKNEADDIKESQNTVSGEDDIGDNSEESVSVDTSAENKDESEKKILEPTGDEITLSEDLNDDLKEAVLLEEKAEEAINVEKEPETHENAESKITAESESTKEHEVLEPTGDEIEIVEAIEKSENVSEDAQEKLSADTNDDVRDTLHEDIIEETDEYMDDNKKQSMELNDSNPEYSTIEIENINDEIMIDNSDDEEFSGQVAGLLNGITAGLELSDDEDNKDNLGAIEPPKTESKDEQKEEADDEGSDHDKITEDIFNIEDIDINFTPNESLDAENDDFSSLLDMPMFSNVDMTNDPAVDVIAETIESESVIESPKELIAEEESIVKAPPKTIDVKIDLKKKPPKTAETHDVDTGKSLNDSGTFGKPVKLDIDIDPKKGKGV